MSASHNAETRWQKLIGRHTGPPRVSLTEVAWSWFGALLGIGLLALIGSPFFAEHKIPMLLGSFGASAVLIFGMPRSPLAQPRNLIGGHVISALIGVAAWTCCGALFPKCPGFSYTANLRKFWSRTTAKQRAA